MNKAEKMDYLISNSFCQVPFLSVGKSLKIGRRFVA